MRAANKALLNLYGWNGEAINRRQVEYGWGKAEVETLAYNLAIWGINP